MSKRNQKILGIVLLIISWLYFNIGLLFFIDVLQSDHWRSWFRVTAHTYETARIIKPLVSGIIILYIWIQADIERTMLGWMGFAMVVLCTLLYTVLTPAPMHLLKDKKPVLQTVCFPDDPSNCREVWVYPK